MTEHATAHATLLVVYTERLDECLNFYRSLGLTLVREQHGTGPVHYAAELDALVLELYPAASPERATGRIRLGFTVTASAGLDGGRHKLTDPDGRIVDLFVRADAPALAR